MKKNILNNLKIFKPILIYLFEIESAIARKWASAAHRKLLIATWGIPKNPEFFDHQIDLFYLWQKTRSSFWLERGVFGNLALKRGGKMLELACGDGFNARNFYSEKCESIIACDFDRKALSTANKKNGAPNITFVLADIRKNMPDGFYDNIVWDTAIEHFTPNEINSIMLDIKKRLAPDGILSGSTIVEQKTGKSLEQHEYEFKNMADLRRFLTPFFKKVTVFETIHPQRHSLYFWASDETVPFSDNWQHWINH
jgi:SAM-dependent methyltransferase